jgi:acetolactate synthase-1/2/3 large subunit
VANTADVIARRLYEAGCRHAFGIPGGEVLTLIKALHEAGIAFGLAKHENSAGFMAEGTYHASGAPGVLVATLGPGVANAVNVIANAWQDRVPMIFLTGCIDPSDALTYTHQIFDHRALLASVTKATFTMGNAAADVVIDKAVSIATDDPPGPVLVDVPIAVAAAEQPDNATTRRVPPTRGAPPAGPALDEARQWLRDAERPLMVAGVDAIYQGAEAAVYCPGGRAPQPGCRRTVAQGRRPAVGARGEERSGDPGRLRSHRDARRLARPVAGRGPGAGILERRQHPLRAPGDAQLRW